MPTPTLEEYLETIYKLSANGVVRPTQIAEAIGVSGPTVTATLGRLEAHGLVSREGREVVLTAAGTAQSLEIVRKHRIAERFLVDILGLDWDEAHEDACLLEHAMSPRVVAALEAFLENPTECPHGHPIPSADGTVALSAAGTPLSEVEPGHTVSVLRVAEDDETLGYLGDQGLVPGARVVVVAVEPFGGPLSVSVDGTARTLAREVAARVIVSTAT